MPLPLTVPFAAIVPNRSAPPRGEGHSVTPATGLNFARTDHLGLTFHPDLRAADLERADADANHPRPHPETPDRIAGLEARLARFLRRPAVVAHASGDAAIRSTLRGLLSRADTVILDAGSNPAMFTTVLACGARLLRSPPGSLDAVERRLLRLRRQPGAGRILVCVPAIARLTSVSADLAELSALCAKHDATLVVDASQDLGAVGQAGRGMAEVQGCLGQIDVILGDLAGAFGAPAGFAAFRDAALAETVAVTAGPGPRSSRFVAPLLAALTIVDSAEGRRRRRQLHGNVLRLRNHLMADGLRVIGQPSPVVPVLLDPGKAAALDALVRSAGPVVPLLQAPEVAGHAPRWHIRLTSDHGPADIDNLADLLRDVTRALDRPARAPRVLEPLPQP